MPRCYNHDYRSRCIYHITLRKDPAAPFFGRLCGEYPNVGIARSPLGAVIESNIRRFPAFHSALRVLQYSIMPDHLHLLLFVTAPVPYQLGNYIGMFKTAVHGRNRRRWLHAGANGGVLVSPFISTSEKAVRAEAEAAGARFILITAEPFGERYKPAGHDFDLCAAGRMLIISINQPGDLSRATCLAMNELAGAVTKI